MSKVAYYIEKEIVMLSTYGGYYAGCETPTQEQLLILKALIDEELKGYDNQRSDY